MFWSLFSYTKVSTGGMSDGNAQVTVHEQKTALEMLVPFFSCITHNKNMTQCSKTCRVGFRRLQTDNAGVYNEASEGFHLLSPLCQLPILRRLFSLFIFCRHGEFKTRIHNYGINFNHRSFCVEKWHRRKK